MIATVPAPTSAAAAPAPAPIAAPTPRLLNMVEPDIPARLIARITRLATFQVGFTINADGTVSAVGVRGGDQLRAMDSAVLSAVQQWRYAPLPQAMPHQVELLYRPE